ncbi:MAG: ferredoxin family protein [bacterium]
MRYWRKPLDAEEITVPRGMIHILADQCKGCAFCVEYCPKHVLRLSDGFNIKGYHPPIVVDGNECLHCQLCEIICPEFAIFVTRKNEQKVSRVAPDLNEERVERAG